MKRLFGGTVHSALVHAATDYDRKESRKKGYNHYALAIYLGRIGDIEEEIAQGVALRAALLAGFTGRLLDCLLVAIGESKFTKEEMQGQDYVYRRAKP